MNLKEQLHSIFTTQKRPIQYLQRYESELYKQYEQLLKEEYNNQKVVLLFEIRNLHNIPPCKVCGRPVSNNGYRFYDFCSPECRAAGADYETITSKYKQTCIERYGVTNANKLQSVREKIYKTCEERYGDKFVNRNEDVKAKRKQTCLEMYGVDNAAKSDIVKEHAKQTCRERFGSDYFIQTPEFKEKSSKTLHDKYGVEHISQVQEIKDQKREKSLEKYGTECVLQAQEVKDKIKQTNLERHGVEYPQQNKEIAAKRGQTQKELAYDRLERFKDICIPLFTKDEYEGTSNTKLYRWKCSNCGNEFDSVYVNGLVPICEHCRNKYGSMMQKELTHFIRDELQQNAKFNTRSVIAPKELDIYIPDKKIAIEFNGMFYHSEQFVGSDYHLSKTEECEALGIHLIHIWEYDWLTKKDIIKNRLKYILGIYDKTVYGRKCAVKEIDSKTANTFLNETHLQGGGAAKVHLGLFNANELLAVMTFGTPRFNEKYEWELIRYAANCKIIGGAAKLLKYFELTYHPKSLLSYADRCWSQGNLYYHLGFTLQSKSTPNYVYSIGNNINNVQVLSRYQCQKHKLPELLGEKFDPNLSESENMRKAFYCKVYDCGNLVFTKIYTEK